MTYIGSSRLQTGMRGAWGKPYGTVARVNIGQIILSIRCKEQNAHVVQEALRRARYKFPGRQKIIVSKKWGFTNVNKEDYIKMKEDKLVWQYVTLDVSPRLGDTNRLVILAEMALTCSTSSQRASWRIRSGPRLFALESRHLPLTCTLVALITAHLLP